MATSWAYCLRYNPLVTSTEPHTHPAGDDGYLTIHGLRHHYLRWGDVANDPVVFLHGLMNNGRYWEHIA